MKLANLNHAQGRVAWVFAAAAFLLPGCDGGSDDTGADTESGSGSQSTDDSGEDSSGGEDTETSDGTESATSGADTTGEETTGPPPAGLGCGDPPPCDRGAFSGSIRIESSDQIEEIAGYTHIDGWLEIYQTDLTCLDFLACVETVGHDVTIFGNDFLTDVSGTDNIANLGTATVDEPEADKDGTLVISENAMLEDINGFNALEQVQATLLISENESMTEISGFDTLVGVRKDFQIRFNPVLNVIASAGLRDILFIGGECVVTNNSSLCISDVQDMCELGIKQGPFGGNTVNNDNSC